MLLLFPVCLCSILSNENEDENMLVHNKPKEITTVLSEEEQGRIVKEIGQYIEATERDSEEVMKEIYEYLDDSDSKIEDTFYSSVDDSGEKIMYEVTTEEIYYSTVENAEEVKSNDDKIKGDKTEETVDAKTTATNDVEIDQVEYEDIGQTVEQKLSGSEIKVVAVDTSEEMTKDINSDEASSTAERVNVKAITPERIISEEIFSDTNSGEVKEKEIISEEKMITVEAICPARSLEVSTAENNQVEEIIVEENKPEESTREDQVIVEVISFEDSNLKDFSTAVVYLEDVQVEDINLESIDTKEAVGIPQEKETNVNQLESVHTKVRKSVSFDCPKSIYKDLQDVELSQDEEFKKMFNQVVDTLDLPTTSDGLLFIDNPQETQLVDGINKMICEPESTGTFPLEITPREGITRDTLYETVCRGNILLKDCETNELSLTSFVSNYFNPGSSSVILSDCISYLLNFILPLKDKFNKLSSYVQSKMEGMKIKGFFSGESFESLEVFFSPEFYSSLSEELEEEYKKIIQLFEKDEEGKEAFNDLKEFVKLN